MNFPGLGISPGVLLPGIVALVLAGCEPAQPPSDSDLLNDALPEGTTIPAAWSTAGAPTSAVGGNWVASFRDSNMTSLVNEALRNNRDLAAAAARVEAALQTAVIAGAPLYPQIGAGAGARQFQNYSTFETPFGSFPSERTSESRGGVLSASWELDVWGRLRSDKAANTAAARSVADEAVFAQQSIAATTARAWIANVKLAKLETVSRRSANIYNELLTIATEQEDAGVVSDFDVVQARSRLNAAKAATSEIQAGKNEAIGSLEVLLGRYPSLKLRPASSYPRMPGSLPRSGLPLSLLDRRPDVSAARNRVIASFYAVDVAKLTRLPGVSVSAARGTLFDPSFLLVGANPDFLKLGVDLLQPIFTGGALQAEVAKMTAKQAEAVAEYGQTVLKAYSEVETGLANEKVLRQELANWRASLKDATAALELANDNYIAGTIDMTGLLVLQEFQIDRQVSVIETEASLLNNRVKLYLALGEPY